MNSFLKTSVAYFLRAKHIVLGTGGLQGRRHAPALKELKPLVWGLVREVRWTEQPMCKPRAAVDPKARGIGCLPGPDVHGPRIPVEFRECELDCPGYH